MIKLVAFDWNGTLLADTQTVVDCTNIELKNLGVTTITIAEYREKFTIPIVQFFKNVGVDVNKIEARHKESARIFHTEYEKRVKICRTRAQAKVLLSWLAARKIKSVILSNHATEKIGQQTKRLKIAKFFDAILANNNVGDAYSIKGKERKLIAYMRKNKIKASEVLIVGDTDEEIIIGRDMGAKTVAITNGHSSISRLKVAKPDYLINSLKEVIGIIKKFKILNLKFLSLSPHSSAVIFNKPRNFHER